MADPPRRTEGRIGLTNGIEAVQDGRIQLGKCPCQRSEWTQFRHRMPMASSMGKPTPNALENFELGASVDGDRNREEFEQLGSDAGLTCAHRRAALIIATIALLPSIIPPEKITAYLSSKPWVSWFSE
jgi:hypothetical protein